MCTQNKKDVDEMQADYRKGLDFHFVSSAEEVLAFALLPEKVKKAVDLSIKKEKEILAV